MKRFPRSRSGVPGRYPLATIATYGPDITLATRLVVSVLEQPGQRDPSAVRTWTTQAVDVRHDPTIAADVATFVHQQRAKETITSDRIIGCPHEEGIDYPMGRACPRCPFWAGIDRFTHEPLMPPAVTMAPAEILADLSADKPKPPREALESGARASFQDARVCRARASCRWKRPGTTLIAAFAAPGGYDAHSEKLTAFRPSATPRAISHDNGAICVYRGHTVLLE